MSSTKINQRILDRIAEHSAGDEVIEQFLIGLVYEEAEHPGQWHWKAEYRKLIDRYSAAWEAGDED
jgi:hypothetical protein